jgi:hypothetical protein
LEAVLTFQSAELDNRLQLLQSASDSVLAQLDGSENETMQRLLQLKHSLSSFDVQIKEFREAVDYLTDDEDDMQLLSSMGEIDHTETAEQLLEHFSFVAEEMENEAHQVARNIQGAEEVLAISLDSTRNDLIKLQLFISTGSAFLCRIRPCCVCVSYSARFSISLCTPLFLSVFFWGGLG